MLRVWIPYGILGISIVVGLGLGFRELSRSKTLEELLIVNGRTPLKQESDFKDLISKYESEGNDRMGDLTLSSLTGESAKQKAMLDKCLSLFSLKGSLKELEKDYSKAYKWCSK